MTLAERTVLRIREEMTERKISQRDIADKLRCSQGRVAKILNGGVNLRVNDVAILADAVGITPVEALRDRGMEFYAELTPTEVKILQGFRRRPNMLQAAMAMLDISPTSNPKPPVRQQAKRGRPLNSELAKR